MIIEGLRYYLFFCLVQGDYDPVKTRVIHLKLNPTAEAKQQRRQEAGSVQEELTRLRELVRSYQEGGVASQDYSSIHTPGFSITLPPSKEVLGKIPNMETRH